MRKQAERAELEVCFHLKIFKISPDRKDGYISRAPRTIRMGEPLRSETLNHQFRLSKKATFYLNSLTMAADFYANSIRKLFSINKFL